MNGQLDQLHYSWVNRGIEGRNRFQIAAMSAGLASGPRAALLPVLKTMCRYDFDGKRSGAISYGWTEIGEHRIAFRRAPVPRTGRMVGNFTAHVVVGDKDDLTGSAIAARYGSPFWWDGDQGPQGGTELPTLDVSLIPEGPFDAHPEAGAFAAALSSAPDDQPLLVRGDSAELARLMFTVARRCPELVDNLPFSTFECESAGFPLRLVGTDLPGPLSVDLGKLEDAVADPETTGLIERLMDESPEAKEIREVSVEVAGPGDATTQRTFLASAREVASARDGESLSRRVLLKALESPTVANLVTSSPHGREVLAGEIVTRRIRPSDAVRLVMQLSASREDSMLAEIIGTAVRSGSPAGWSSLADAFGKAGFEQAAREFTDAVLDHARRSTGSRELSGKDLYRLLARASLRRMPNGEIANILALIDPTELPELSEDHEIPAEYLRGPFVALCEMNASYERWAVDVESVIESRPGLISVVPDGQAGDGLARVLTSMGEGRARDIVLRNAQGAALPTPVRGLCRGWGDRILFSLIGAPSPSRSVLELAGRLYALGGDPRDRELAALAFSLADPAPYVDADPFDCLGSLESGQDRDYFLTHTLRVQLPMVRDFTDIWTLCRAVQKATGDLTGEQSVLRILAVAVNVEPSSARFAVLSWFENLVENGEIIKTGRAGRVKHRKLAREYGLLLDRVERDRAPAVDDPIPEVHNSPTDLPDRAES